MSKRFLVASATLALTLVGACLTGGVTASAATPSSGRVIVPATGLPLGEMPTAGQRARALRAQRLKGAIPSNAHLTYYGGPVLSKPHVVTALWGSASVGHTYIPQVDGSTAPNMDGWFAHVTNSAHFSWLSEYNTPAVGGTNQKFGYGSFTSRATLTLPVALANATTVIDGDIQTQLIAAINAQTLPKPVADSTGNVNTIYALYFPSNVVINDGSGNLSGVVFCAYHGATTALVNGMHVPYMILPDPTSPGMNNGCGAGSAYQNLESYTSHELVEAMTDAMVSFAGQLAPPLGWYDNNNGEIGDICNQIVGTVTGTDFVSYTAQGEWSNGAAGCIVSKQNTTPGPATNVNIGLLTTNLAQLTWGAPASDGGTAITGWSVYRSADGSLGSVVATLPTTATSYNDTLSPGLTYFYTLVANNVNGSGTPSAQVAIGAVTTPGAPTSVSSVVSGANAITTSWTAPTSNGGAALTGYSVYRYVTGSNSATHVVDLAATQTSYQDTGLTPGTSYEYTVSAANSGGSGPQSAHSNPVVATSPPGAPTSVGVTATDIGQLTIAWAVPLSNGGSPVTGYNVYRATAPGGPFTSAGPTLGANARGFVDSGLTGGTVEYYEVAAVNSLGEGSGSAPVSATAESLPGASSSVTATAVAGGSATVSWTAAAFTGGTAIIGYHVHDNTGAFACDTTTALSCTISGLAIGTPYTFSVQATNRWGSGLSSEPSSPIIASDIPSAPAITALAAGNRSVKVTWFAPESAGGLSINQYKVTASPGGAVCVTPGKATTCSVSGLNNGSSYTFTVVASNPMGDGPASAPSANATPRTTPGAPRLIKATYAAGHKTTVTWSAPASNGGAALTAYSVRWSANGKTWSSWSSTRLTRSWTHTGFKKGVRIYVQVAAANAAGRGAAAQIAVKPTK
jgi:fibronectin type 3 domain-containing protein